MAKKEGGQPGNKNAEKWTEEELLEVGNKLLIWMQKPDNVFFEKFLLLEFDIYGSFLATYKNKYQSFSKLIEKAKKLQEMKMCEGGLKKDFDSAITKFCLINNHGYTSERTINENKNIEQGKIEIVQNIIKK